MKLNKYNVDVIFGNKEVSHPLSGNLFLVPRMLGKKMDVHVGNRVVTVSVRENKVGHRLGEFVRSRKLHRYKFKYHKQKRR